MGKPKSDQLQMFPSVPQVGRRAQVAPALWDAILVLRRGGKTVYACGRQHKVDERLVDDAELLRLARPFMTLACQGDEP